MPRHRLTHQGVASQTTGEERLSKTAAFPVVADFLLFFTRNSLLVSDTLITMTLWFGAFLWVVMTANDFGVGYDEPIYGGYTLKYLAWLDYLVRCWSQGQWLEPFRFEVIDLYWKAKDMHPAIPKLVAAVGYAMMLPLMGDEFASMRAGTAFLFGAMLAAIYWFGRSQIGRAGALFSAFAVAFMPRLFGDAHFLTMDMPVTATTFIGTVLLLRALERPNWKWVTVALIAVGMAFASKANGFLIIPAAICFILASGEWRMANGQQSNFRHFVILSLRRLVIVAIVAVGAMAFLFATWLWLWIDPINRFHEYITFHAKHFGVHTYYLGRLWDFAPWHYPFVMTLVTVPTVTLLFAIVGLGLTLQRWRTSPPLAQIALISYFVHIAPFLLPTTPVYNGVRLFEPAFPFVGILAGYAFGLLAQWLLRWLKERASQWISQPRLVIVALGIGALAPSAYGTLASHPFELSYYNAVVGGVQGAVHRWGFEGTYWGVNLLNVIPFLNRLPEGTKVLVIPHPLHAYLPVFYQRAGALRTDLEFPYDPDYNIKNLLGCDFVVFQCSQTEWELLPEKFRKMVWKLWREATPTYAVTYNGVIIVGIYDKAAVKLALQEIEGGSTAP